MMVAGTSDRVRLVRSVDGRSIQVAPPKRLTAKRRAYNSLYLPAAADPWASSFARTAPAERRFLPAALVRSADKATCVRCHGAPLRGGA